MRSRRSFFKPGAGPKGHPRGSAGDPVGTPVEKTDGPVVLWVGRLDAVKNWRAFVELAKVLRGRTDAEFRLVSGGPYADTEGVELDHAVKAMGGRLRWMREVEHARMPSVYRTVAESGGCMVSTSRAESFGMAVLEAMACGCPVVVPEIEGLRDLVRDGQTGRMYRTGNVAAACEQVLATLGDEAGHRAEMVESARRVAMQFDPEAAAERFLNALAIWSGAGDRALQKVPELPEVEGRRVVIIPPAGPGRPWQWGQALAREGCVVFYCDPHRVQSFEEVEPREQAGVETCA